MDAFTLFYDDMKLAFEASVIQTSHGLEWPVTKSQTYGKCSWSTDGFNVTVRAHRVAWMLENGPIPNGYVVDHDPTCPKSCVTASHFRLFTIAEHSRIGWERGELNGGWGTKRERIHPPRPEPFIWQETKECLRCPKSFLMEHHAQIYCSRGCERHSFEERRSPRRYPRPEVRTCSWCETEFKPKRKDSMLCSRKCIDDEQNHLKKLRKESDHGVS